MTSVDDKLIEMSKSLRTMKNDLDTIMNERDWPSKIMLHGSIVSSALFRTRVWLSDLIHLVKEVSE